VAENLLQERPHKVCNRVCNSRYYKREQRANFLDTALTNEREIRTRIVSVEPSRKGRTPQKYIPNNFTTQSSNPLTRELLDIHEQAVVIGLSRRTIQRLLKDDNFPRLQIGKRLLFEKGNVIHYLTNKYATK